MRYNMSVISTDTYIALLYKKFMGAANSVPGSKNYLGDVSLFARPRIFANQQLFTNSIPDIPPNLGSTQTFNHPAEQNRLAVWNNTDATANSLLNLGTVYIGDISASDTGLDVTPTYSYLKKYVNVALVQERPGVSYTCNSVSGDINYLSDQIPYNYSKNLEYAPSVILNTYNTSTTSFDQITLNPTLGDYPYFLDQDAGVLTFIRPTPIDINTQYVSMTYWRYEGAKGASSLSGVIDGGNANSHQ